MLIWMIAIVPNYPISVKALDYSGSSAQDSEEMGISGITQPSVIPVCSESALSTVQTVRRQSQGQDDNGSNDKGKRVWSVPKYWMSTNKTTEFL